MPKTFSWDEAMHVFPQTKAEPRIGWPSVLPTWVVWLKTFAPFCCMEQAEFSIYVCSRPIKKVRQAEFW